MNISDFRNNKTRINRWNHFPDLVAEIDRKLVVLYAQGLDYASLRVDVVRDATASLASKAMATRSLHETQLVLQKWKSDLSDLILKLESTLKNEEFDFLDSRIEISFGGGLSNYKEYFENKSISELLTFLERVNSEMISESAKKSFVSSVMASAFVATGERARNAYLVLSNPEVQAYISSQSDSYKVSKEFQASFALALTKQKRIAPKLVLKDFVAGICDSPDVWRRVNMVEPILEAAASRSLSEEGRHRLLEVAFNNISDPYFSGIDTYIKGLISLEQSVPFINETGWQARFLGKKLLMAIRAGHWVADGWKDAVIVAQCVLQPNEAALALNKYLLETYPQFRDEDYNIFKDYPAMLGCVSNKEELDSAVRKIFIDTFYKKLSGSAWDNDGDYPSQYKEISKIVDSFGCRRALIEAFNEAADKIDVLPKNRFLEERFNFFVQTFGITHEDLISKKAKRSYISSEFSL